MKKSCKFYFLLFFACFINGLAISAGIQPVERSVGKLRISIDPRMELLSTVQLLSNYPGMIINREFPYGQDILDCFELYSSQRAVAMTDLLQRYGFSHDAPVTFMLYLSQLPELKVQIPFSDYLLKRNGERNNLERYRKSMKRFAKRSDFENFWNSKIPYYNQILDLTIDDMGKADLIKALEEYFNETWASYDIVIAPAFKGGYGPRITDANGNEHIYACLSPTSVKEGIPYLDANKLIHYVWHEFGHSFVNPLTDKYIDRVLVSDKLFEPIKDMMTRQAYKYWETCVNEHIVRAIVIRLMELHLDATRTEALLANELGNGFVYIEPLIGKLKEFEHQRDRDNISFSDFYPELLDVLDSLREKEYWKQVDLNFKGPIHEIFMNGKIAVIYPTRDLDAEALETAQKYASAVFSKFIEPIGGLLLADTTALKTDLSEYGIIAYGTIESNSFLKRYAASFPFRIENQTIYAEKEYTDQKVKLISCVPNPHNPKNGMVIYTALSNRNILDINKIQHGAEDYILFLDHDTILCKGFYKKNGKWTF